MYMGKNHENIERTAPRLHSRRVIQVRLMCVYKCSLCGDYMHITDTRKKGGARRRRCDACGNIINTIETVESSTFNKATLNALYVELDNITASIKECLDIINESREDNDE